MRRRIGTAISGIVALVGASVVSLVLAVGPAGAIDVGDEAALRLAWGNASESLIVLTADIVLTDCGEGSVDRTSALAIRVDGNGHTITQNCDDIVLLQSGTGAVTLVNLTIKSGAFGIVTNSGPIVVERSGFADQHYSLDSAAVYSETGSITVSDTWVSNVVSEQDAAAFNTNGGTLQVNRTRVSGVKADTLAYGGFALGDIAVGDTSIRGLGAEIAIGLHSGRGSITLDRSTIADATGTDGAFGLFAEFTTVRNSTITGVNGPAVYSEDSTIVYSDIVGNGGDVVFGPGEASEAAAEGDLTLNVGGPGISGGFDALAEVDPEFAQVMAEQLTIFASVVTSPKNGAVNCEVDEPVTSIGYNFADDTTCGLTSTGDTQQVGANPLLGALADNGGPTPTLLPQLVSPLVNAIPPAACQTAPATGIAVDQRGEPRPALGACDIGSVELQPAILVLTFTG